MGGLSGGRCGWVEAPPCQAPRRLLRGIQYVLRAIENACGRLGKFEEREEAGGRMGTAGVGGGRRVGGASSMLHSWGREGKEAREGERAGGGDKAGGAPSRRPPHSRHQREILSSKLAVAPVSTSTRPVVSFN